MEKSCGVVLFNKQKVLLLRHSKDESADLSVGHWDFPKGHVEKSETEFETAKRELLEETGIADVSLLENFREKISYSFFNGHSTINKEVIFFVGITTVYDVKLSHEHSDYEWLDFTSALERLTYDNARLVLKDAIEFYDEN